jgi:flagellar hook-associated protein 2
LSLSVDGQSIGPLTLAHGAYTPQQLAQEVQGKINGGATTNGRQVAVSVSGSQLVVTSASFGRASQVNIGAGTALTALGFAGNEAATGQDVAGTFIVNGVVESAVGSGQFLSGSPTNANTAGLEIRSTLSAAQIPPGGAVSSLNVTQGLASSLSTALTNLLDPVSGRLKTLDDGFTQSINTIKSSITQENAYIVEKQQSLQNQFAGLEATISKLQSIGNFLTSQFTSTTSVKQTGGITQPVSSSSSGN